MLVSIGDLRTVPKSLEKMEIEWKSRNGQDYPDDSITENIWNRKNIKVLMRFAVT